MKMHGMSRRPSPSAGGRSAGPLQQARWWECRLGLQLWLGCTSGVERTRVLIGIPPWGRFEEPVQGGA